MLPLFTSANWQAFRASLGPITEDSTTARRPPTGLGGRRMRQSEDRPGSIVATGAAMLAPIAPAERWRGLNLDSQTLDRVSVNDLVELLADVSPDVSRALWDFLRICNPGHTAEVLRPSGVRAPQAAQQALAGVLAAISAQHGDLKVAIGRLFIGAFLRGGFAAELILDADGRQTLGLGTPDPASLRFRARRDPILGVVHEPGQQQGARWVSLAIPTFVHIPIDPFPGQPQGRAPAHPAIFPTLFALAMLQDVRRVVQQQGYPRLDLVVLLDKLTAMVPDDIDSGTQEYQEWLSAMIDEVSGFYAALEPDDAYVHTDVVQVNRPVGAVDANSLGAIPKLIELLERQAVRALKTAPLLMGITDGVSEANANRQVDLYLMGVRSLQQLAENLLERLLSLALEAQGVAGVVRFRFAEAQGLQRLRNAQVQQLEIANAREAYLMGWVDQNTAAMMAIGVSAAAEPAPRRAATMAPVVEPAERTQP